MREQQCSWCGARIGREEHVAVSYLHQVTNDGLAFEVVSEPARDCATWCLACAPTPQAVAEALEAIRTSARVGGAR